jgi:solute carrier family 25 citrate transporter 1
VRFGTYNFLKSTFEPRLAPGEKFGSIATFCMGGVAGIVTVYSTQPIDTVKTRMQSIEARQAYRSSWHCATRIVKEEGVRKLWSGAVMRLGRLIFSGGIVFAMYEKSMAMFDFLDPERVYV